MAAQLKDLRRGLAKAFGGPGSEGPSAVLCEPLLHKLGLAFREIFHSVVALVLTAFVWHMKAVLSMLNSTADPTDSCVVETWSRAFSDDASQPANAPPSP